MKFPSYFTVSYDGRTRFSSVFKAMAIEHAQRIYKSESVICEIEETTR